MPSKVEIINLALGKLAQDVGIAAVTDQSKAARIFSRLWEPMRDLVLADRLWPWAIQAQALALEGQPPLPGWGFRYARPAGCITAVAVTDVGALARIKPLSRFAGLSGNVAFEMGHGAQGMSVMCNVPQAWLVYVGRVENTDVYPPHFVEALACKLAEEAAPMLLGDMGFGAKSNLKQFYMMALSESSAHDLNESVHGDDLGLSACVQARL